MKKFLPYIANFILILSFLLGSIYYVTIDTDFYEKQYIKNGTADHIGISQEDLMSGTKVVIDYLKGEAATLDVKAEIKGEVREIFDQRERDHMIDVKALFLLLERVFKSLVILWAFLSALILFIYKKQGIRVLAKAFVPTAIGFSLVTLVLAGIFILNFDWFWTNFHLLIFTNDLWILDPKVSVMINMFPLEFFYDCCFRILGIFLGDIILMALISNTVERKIVKI